MIITAAFISPALVGTLTDQTCSIWQEDCGRFVIKSELNSV